MTFARVRGRRASVVDNSAESKPITSRQGLIDANYHVIDEDEDTGRFIYEKQLGDATGAVHRIWTDTLENAIKVAENYRGERIGRGLTV